MKSEYLNLPTYLWNGQYQEAVEMSKAKDLNEKEIGILKRMKEICDKWRTNVYVEGAPSIEVSFALEGVRSSGSVHTKNSLLHAAEGFGNEKVFDIHINELLKAKKDFIQMQELFWESYKICTECKGSQGEWYQPAQLCNRENWMDCYVCDGKGYIEK